MTNRKGRDYREGTLQLMTAKYPYRATRKAMRNASKKTPRNAAFFICGEVSADGD
jgi:hypothetical protein